MSFNLKIHPILEPEHFDCVICYNESCEPSTKYNCTQCDKKICDDCYRKHILTSQLCVFCRSQLNITRYRLSQFQRKRLYYYNKLMRVLIVVFIWYTLLLTYLYIISKLAAKKRTRL